MKNKIKRLVAAITLASSGFLSVQAASFPGLTLPEVLDRMMSVQRSIQTIQLHFVETRGKGTTADTVEGDVAFKRPQHLRIAQTVPEKQTLWSDGEKLWLYSPAQEQEMTGAWKVWLSRSGFPVPLLSFISDFGPDVWTARYKILFGGYDDHLYKVIFKPKMADDLPIELWVSDETFLPVRGHLSSSTSPVSVYFKDLRLNTFLNDTLFIRNVPKGTAVVPLPS